MKIRLYDKDFNALTTLLISAGASDYNNLEYKTSLGEVGQASFLVRLDNPKATTANLRHYNKVEILDDDDTPRWVGVIVKKQVRLNQVNVSCYSLLHLLEKRLTGDEDHATGAAGTKVAALLAATNADQVTGITAGTINVSTSVDITFNRSSLLQAIDSLAQATNAQMHVDAERQLHFLPQVGQDLSAIVTFRYNIDQIQNANILEFDVQDIGTEIASKTYGKADVLASIQEDSTLRTTFGLLEQSKNFREPNDQATLDALTAKANQADQFSPNITLSPKEADNFEVGDLVTVTIKNRLIDIEDVYQVLEKQVNFTNAQKRISVRISSNPTDLVRIISKLKRNVDLLNREL